MAESFQVIHVTLSLDVGGLERNIVNQVREGQQLGQRLAVICLERPGTLAPEVERLGATVLCLQKRPGIRLSVIGQIRKVLQELRPDVVHTHQIGSLFYTGPAARGAGVPLIVHTEHGKEDYAGQWRRRWLGRMAGRYAHRFFCLTEDMAAEIIRQRIVPLRKVQVIANGIDVERFQRQTDIEELRRSLGIPIEASVIGTVGRLVEVKRQDLLIRCFGKVSTQVPNAHLLVVGDGPMREPLSQLAASLGLANCIHFAGYQAQPERFYQLMDLFALTSSSEGMPQAVIEASAAGIPVVASRVGGIPEMIEDGRSGLLFAAGDENSLADALASVLANRELACKLGAAGRVRVEQKFHVRRMAADYHAHFLQELLNKKRG